MACVKAAYAMPELSRLFDAVGRSAPIVPPQLSGRPRGPDRERGTDGSVLGLPPRPTAVALLGTRPPSYAAADASQTWGAGGAHGRDGGRVRLGDAEVPAHRPHLVPLYLLLLLAAAIVWFMEQLRFFLAVSGTMMLPLFIGMFSPPEATSTARPPRPT